MKKSIYIILISLFAFSCEDVIDLDVPTSEPKLVIDASINWFKGTTGSNQKIKLTLTAPYFNNGVPPANGAQVTITDTANNTFEFIEEGNTGIYKNTSFLPIINDDYNLTIIYQGETYTATETLKPVNPIEYIEQNNEGGFLGDEIEIKAYFTDPLGEENYYFFEFITSFPIVPSLEVYKDEFVNGNPIFGYFSDEDLSIGDQLIIRNYGISERFYEFMYILLQQNSEEGGFPFEVQPATVRGNCVNQSNPGNFPLGYFRLSEVDELIYIVE